jgi:hypothetical protein
MLLVFKLNWVIAIKIIYKTMGILIQKYKIYYLGNFIKIIGISFGKLNLSRIKNKK